MGAWNSMEPVSSPGVFREWRRGNRHELKYRKLSLSIRKAIL